VSGNPQAVTAFLTTNAPPWISNLLSGQSGNINGGVTSYIVSDSVQGSDWNSGDRLVFVIADLGNGLIGIRADAEVIPPGSVCPSSPGASSG
jgi:hypothetical protein